MKSVFIAGSRRFSTEIEKLDKLCKENGIKSFTAGKILNKEDTFQSEKSALFRALHRIEISDIVYVMARKGYVGKTVALEIAYAFSKKREIISSEPIEDFSVRALVSKVMGHGELIKYAKG